MEKFLLAKNDIHDMKQILYDMGPQVVGRWPLERVLKLSHSFLLKRRKLTNFDRVCAYRRMKIDAFFAHSSKRN